MNDVASMPTAPADGVFAGFTAREFMQLITDGAFDDLRAELIDGVIVKVAPAHIEHSLQNALLTGRLISLLAELDLRAGVDLAIDIDETTLLGIDIAVVNASAPERGAVSGAHVDLAIEIAATTLAKDLGLKAAKYAQAGIATYWVVDIKARAVHVMTTPQPGGYLERTIVRFGEALPVPGTNRTIVVSD